MHVSQLTLLKKRDRHHPMIMSAQGPLKTMPNMVAMHVSQLTLETWGQRRLAKSREGNSTAPKFTNVISAFGGRPLATHLPFSGVRVPAFVQIPYPRPPYCSVTRTLTKGAAATRSVISCLKHNTSNVKHADSSIHGVTNDERLLTVLGHSNLFCCELKIDVIGVRARREIRSQQTIARSVATTGTPIPRRRHYSHPNRRHFDVVGRASGAYGKIVQATSTAGLPSNAGHPMVQVSTLCLPNQLPRSGRVVPTDPSSHSKSNHIPPPSPTVLSVRGQLTDFPQIWDASRRQNFSHGEDLKPLLLYFSSTAARRARAPWLFKGPSK